jgi:hypothetical protein
MTAADKADLAATFIGVDATIASVLTVYQLFALQTWVERCHAAESRARRVAETTPSGDLERVRAVGDCRRALAGYPRWQMAAIMLMLASLTVLGVAIIANIPGWARAFALVPVCLLTAVAGFSTIAASVGTRRRLQEAIVLCDPSARKDSDPSAASP